MESFESISIESLTEEQLNKLSEQIENKKEELKQSRIKKRRKEVHDKLKEINDNPIIKEWLLKTLKHGYTTCNDNLLNNGIYYDIYKSKHSYRCKKCTLMQLLKQQEHNEDNLYEYKFDFDFNFDINFDLIDY